MEEPDNEIGGLMFTQIDHPPTGRLLHIAKLQSLPQRTGKPMRYSRCGESHEGYLQTTAFNYDIGRQERMLGLFKIDISPDSRTL